MKTVEVVCAVVVKDKKIFICQRGVGKSLENFWEFPGGKIEKNETKEDAIIREIQEELTGTIKPKRFLMTVEHTYEDLGAFKPFHIIMHAYLCELTKGELIISEHKDSLWVNKKEFGKVEFAEADKPIVKYIIDNYDYLINLNN